MTAIGALLARVDGELFQNSWVVDDLAAAEAAMRTTLGCDEFVGFEMDPKWQVRGETISSPMTCGFARSGNMQIELMQPLGTGGVVAEFLSRYGPGPHHLGVRVDDLDAAVAAAGVPRRDERRLRLPAAGLPRHRRGAGPLHRAARGPRRDALGHEAVARRPNRDPTRRTHDRHPGTTGRPARGSSRPSTPSWAPARSSYEDSISPEFFEAEREAVFKRTWLYVGREERLPEPGTYFTRELPGRPGVDRHHPRPRRHRHAFHNVCAHRGNKVVWQEHPQRGVQRARAGSSPASTTAGATGSTAASPTSPTRRSSSTSTRTRCGMPEVALRGVRRVHLRQPVRGPGAAAHVPRRPHPRARGLPVRPDDRSATASRPASTATGSSPSTRCASGTTRRTSTAASSTPTWRRPRRWCRPSTPTTTTSSGPTC